MGERAAESLRAGGRDSHRWAAGGARLLAGEGDLRLSGTTARYPGALLTGDRMRGQLGSRPSGSRFPRPAEQGPPHGRAPSAIQGGAEQPRPPPGAVKPRGRAGGRPAACAAARTSPHGHTRAGAGRRRQGDPSPRPPRSQPDHPTGMVYYPFSPALAPHPCWSLGSPATSGRWRDAGGQSSGRSFRIPCPCQSQAAPG